MKNVLVTGSAKGIGKATITEFAKRGYNTVIVYNESKNEAELLKKEITSKYNITATSIQCDVTSEESIKNMIDVVINHFGKIDILINNAAYACDNYLEDKTKEEFMKVLEVNLLGPFLVTKYAHKYMHDGIIINVSSTDADDTYNDISIDYCASKAGLNNLTKSLSMAISDNKVVAVMPNWVKTESVLEMNQDFLQKELVRIGQKRLQEPEEIACKIASIAEDSNIKTGSIIRIDGDVKC